MRQSKLGRRAVLALLGSLAALCALGADCTIGLPGFGGILVPVDDFVDVELVNETDFSVDPGLFVNDSFIDTVELDLDEVRLHEGVECFPGDILGVDPIMILDTGNQVLSLNVPELEEGIDFICGDLVTFFLTQDDEGTFFVEVAVNDVLLTE